jgi:hypothetical protein
LPVVSEAIGKRCLGKKSDRKTNNHCPKVGSWWRTADVVASLTKTLKLKYPSRKVKRGPWVWSP